MRFAIFDHMERRDAPLTEQYEQRLQMIEAADQGGVYCYHKAEHHFTALDVAPSSNLLFAAAAQRTHHIRFGSLVYLLPFYNPLRLLEEICVLDHLTAGRLDIGVGKGVSPVEQRLWGLDSRVAREVFETHFQVLRDGLSANGVCAGEPVSVEARQAGGPPVWYPGNVEYAGSHRLNTIVGGPTSTLAGAVEAYRGFLQSAQTNWNPGVAEPIIGVTRHIYVAPTDELAWARVAQSFPRYHDNLTSLWKKYDEPLPTDPSVGGDTQFALGADLLVAGSPATVAAHIQAVNDVSGIDYFMAAFAWGDLTHEESMSSLALFTREVMPRFRS